MDLRLAVLTNLPLKVEVVNINDPILNIHGSGWSLTISCLWLLRGPGVYMDVAAGDGRIAPDDDLYWEPADFEFLIGRQIVAVTSGPDLIDPIFHFDGGLDLVLFAEDDGWEPWFLNIPGGGIAGKPKPRAT